MITLLLVLLSLSASANALLAMRAAVGLRRYVPARTALTALVDVVQGSTLTRSDTTMDRPTPAPSRVAALYGSRIAHALAAGREIRRAAVRRAAGSPTPAGVTR